MFSMPETNQARNFYFNHLFHSAALRRRSVNPQRGLLPRAELSAGVGDDPLRQHGPHPAAAAAAQSHPPAAEVLAAAADRRPAEFRRRRVDADVVAEPGQVRHHPDEHGQAERASTQRLLAAKVSKFEFGATTAAGKHVQVFGVQVVLSAERALGGRGHVLDPQGPRFDDGCAGEPGQEPGDHPEALAEQRR